MSSSSDTTTKAKLNIPRERITKGYVLGSNPELEAQISRGEVLVARMVVFKRWGSCLNFCRSPLFQGDVVVNTRKDRADALHGDIVAVKLFDRQQWSSAAVPNAVSKVEPAEQQPRALPDGRAIQRCLRQPDATDKATKSAKSILPEMRLAKALNAPEVDFGAELRPTGRIVAVLERNLDAFQVARVLPTAWNPKEAFKLNHSYLFSTYNPLMPLLAVEGASIPSEYRGDLDQYLFLVRMEHDAAGNVPRLSDGDVCRAQLHSSLGKADSVAANNAAISFVHGISPEYFDDEVEACVPVGVMVPDAETLVRIGRRDLRQEEFICTIDPATARDLDDALSIRRSPGGGYHVGVHIADVSHFVEVGCAMDEEARKRASSTYFVDKVVPMLPRRLSEDYCSLNPSEDKFAFSALFELDHDGNMVSEWFGKSVIRSSCRLSYQQANLIVEAKEEEAEVDCTRESEATGVPAEQIRRKVYESVRLLHHVAAKRRKASLERGRLIIGNITLGFDFDEADTQLAPRGFNIRRQIEANWLVEEFMLLANTRVAEKIVQYLPDEALIRRHLPPEHGKVIELCEGLKRHNVALIGASAKDLHHTLEDLKANLVLYDDVCNALKYTQHLAQYMPNGAVDDDPKRGHFALGFPWYTHFTSPIRRYADIIVHRQLQIALEVEQILQERGRTLPSIPSGGVQEESARETAFEANDIDPSSLRTSNLYFSLDEVESIALHINKKFVDCRDAGTDSVRLFLCLYIMALQKTAVATQGSSRVLRTEVSVARLTSSAMTLFSRELACEVEVGFKDNKQRFRFVGVGTEEVMTESNEVKGEEKIKAGQSKRMSEKPIDMQKKAHLHFKGGKASMPERHTGAAVGSDGNDRPKGGAAPSLITLSWENPNTGEKVIEEVAMLSTMVADVQQTVKDGHLALNFILLSPSQRQEYYKKRDVFPPTLY